MDELSELMRITNALGKIEDAVTRSGREANARVADMQYGTGFIAILLITADALLLLVLWRVW